jgi:RNA polymerase sigma-70 factor, ECF subfamily
MNREVVGRAMAGDSEAFSELARLSIGRLYRIARLILRDDEQAEDATQEALVAAWRDMSALRDADHFEAWSRRLLVRACYRVARQDRRRHQIEATVQVLDAARDSDRDLADRDQLERGFRRLDTEQRAILVLHHYLGLPLTEVADVLGIPAGTVKSRLHRATGAMRAALDADARMPDVVEGRPV